MKMTEEELKGIERQLSNPKGDFGIEVAKNMNESNITMTIDSIKSLDLLESDTVLEIGHGNCGHLQEIFKNVDVNYVGLEISKTMKDEAERLNKKLINKKNVNFHMYDGITIPFSDNYFEKIFTVNTIYFWQNPINFINEISRVLKTDGTLIVAFAQKNFMKKLPFVKDKFKLYNNEELSVLMKQTNFKIVDIINKTEKVKSKSGELVHRIYTIAKIKR